MKNVFSRLFHILKNSTGNPHEDFLTEIFAEILSKEKILIDFANRFLGGSFSDITHLSVNTQVTYPALPHHQTDSRPDIIIRFFEGTKQYVIFLESKLGSYEGLDQLPRYADHLDEASKQGAYSHLVYVTQYYDDKDEKRIIRGGKNVKFVPLRWYQLFKWIKECNLESDYIAKVVDYMEGIGLQDNRQFTPLDVYGIQQMNRLQRMMDESIDGVVDKVMTDLYGKSLQQYNRYNQVKHLDRYVKASEQNNRATEVVIGFYITDDHYPTVSVVYEFCERRCQDYTFVIAAIHNFIAKHPGWEIFDLNEDVEWKGISFDRSLVEFLPYEDQIAEIQKFFIEKLKELHDLKIKNPEMYWK